MTAIYDFRTLPSMECATFVVDCVRRGWQGHQMDKQEALMIALRERGVKQEEIARVLGIAQANVSKLYNSVSKTGKPRKLSYDEGVALINAFGLDPQNDSAPIEPMSVPVARLAVQYVAQQLGVRIDPDDQRVEDLARDIQAYSELAAASQIGDNLDEARGWLRGRGSRRSTST